MSVRARSRATVRKANEPGRCRNAWSSAAGTGRFVRPGSSASNRDSPAAAHSHAIDSSCVRPSLTFVTAWIRTRSAATITSQRSTAAKRPFAVDPLRRDRAGGGPRSPRATVELWVIEAFLEGSIPNDPLPAHLSQSLRRLKIASGIAPITVITGHQNQGV